MNDKDRFVTFSDRARKVIDLAREEASFFQHHYLGTEHLLLGLLREEEGLAATVLYGLGLTLEKMHAATTELIGHGPQGEVVEIKMTADAQRAVDIAIAEAKRLHSSSVETEHLLLALLHLSECDAAQILQDLSVPPEKVRVRTLQMAGQKSGFTFRRASSTTHATASTSLHTHTPQINDRDRFDKFTERARKVLSLAQEEAQRFQHNYIGTEHLLLGLVREGEGVAAKVLQNLGVELYKVRGAIEFIIGRGDRVVLGEIGLTPRSKKVIELAVDEARRLNHHYIGTEHLLLGLVREGEGIAAGVLQSLGVHLGQVRQETIKVLSAHPTRTAQHSDEQEVEPTVLKDITLSKEAQRVLIFAESSAHAFQHGYVGTEHLLLGLVQEPTNNIGKLFNEQGITYEQVKKAVSNSLGFGVSRRSGALPLTPRAQEIFHTAAATRQPGKEELTPEQLLLAILTFNSSNTGTIFAQLGLDTQKLQTKLQEISHD